MSDSRSMNEQFTKLEAILVPKKIYYIWTI